LSGVCRLGIRIQKGGAPYDSPPSLACSCAGGSTHFQGVGSKPGRNRAICRKPCFYALSQGAAGSAVAFRRTGTLSLITAIDGGSTLYAMVYHPGYWRSAFELYLPLQLACEYCVSRNSATEFAVRRCGCVDLHLYRLGLRPDNQQPTDAIAKRYVDISAAGVFGNLSEFSNSPGNCGTCRRSIALFHLAGRRAGGFCLWRARSLTEGGGEQQRQHLHAPGQLC